MIKTGFIVCLFLGYMNFLYSQTQIGQNILGEAMGDNFGSSTSMPDAQTLAIGAWSNGGGAYYGGHTRVYNWNGVAWVQKGADIDGEAAGDWSGHSVSMPDANTLAIGIPRHDDGGNDAGKVRIYAWNGNNWIQKGADIDGESVEDRSGFTVTMPDANTIAIGAPKNTALISESGHVRIFTWNGIDWIQKGADIDGEGMWDRSGKSLSMPDANTIAIGAFENSQGGTLAGHVRIFEWDGMNWIQKGNDIDGSNGHTWLGYSVSMPDANTLAIGSPADDFAFADAGKVRIYRWVGAWVQMGSDIDGEQSEDNLGFSISMPDNKTIAISEVGKDDIAFEAGQVRVYTWNVSGGDWVQKGMNVNGSASYDYFGWSVSMPNPNTIAIGAREGGSGTGYVQVYSFCDVDNAVTSNQGTLSAVTGSASYQWLDCNAGYAPIIGEIGQSFAPTVNGDYAVEITQDGCIDTSACTSINNVGFQETTWELLPIVHPNPVNDLLQIDIDNEGEIWVEILNLSGKTIQSMRLDTNVIPVGMLATGLYYINIEYKNKRITRRFVKK